MNIRLLKKWRLEADEKIHLSANVESDYNVNKGIWYTHLCVSTNSQFNIEKCDFYDKNVYYIDDTAFHKSMCNKVTDIKRILNASKREYILDKLNQYKRKYPYKRFKIKIFGVKRR